jgi:phosphatidylserine decarboxylase
MLKITKYGFDVVFTIGIISIVAIVSSLFLNNQIVKIVIISFFVVLLIFTLYFFRDPERNTQVNENNIISPADGEICLITRIQHDSILNSEAVQVSIFMSPLNVHVNRIPMSGKIIFKKYIQGEFHVAYEDKASEKNEQTLIYIENEKYKIGVKQIAGYIARRIVNNLKIGDIVSQGERYGMIKFGSRLDVIVPVSTKILVKKGDKVAAGETILGQFN